MAGASITPVVEIMEGRPYTLVLAWYLLSPSPHVAKKHPLQLVTTHARRRAHSQFDNLPWLRELITQSVQINIDDARIRGISNGRLVRVYNDRGQTVLPAEVTQRIMPGVVNIPQGAWYAADEKGIDHSGSVNVLTEDAKSPAGAFCTNTTLVQVEKQGK